MGMQCSCVDGHMSCCLPCACWAMLPQVCNGLVLASDGKKMSKRLKNYPVSTYVHVLSLH